MFIRWHSKAVALLSVGNSMGNIVLNLVSGYLCQYGFDGGWPSVFYLSGVLNLVWLILWYFVASNRPSNHHFISRHELLLISSRSALSGQQQQTQPQPSPTAILRLYFRMIFNVAVLALLLVKMCHTVFNVGLVQTKLPQYMVTVLGMNLEQTSVWITLFHVIIFVG